MRLFNLEWHTQSFQSGTVIVQGSYDYPWLYVHYASDISKHNISEEESDRKRYELAKDIEQYFNGGKRPTWLTDWSRKDTHYESPLGGTLTPTGPMILPPNDNGRLAWTTDESEIAVRHRKEMLQYLSQQIVDLKEHT